MEGKSRSYNFEQWTTFVLALGRAVRPSLNRIIVSVRLYRASDQAGLDGSITNFRSTIFVHDILALDMEIIWRRVIIYVSHGPKHGPISHITHSLSIQFAHFHSVLNNDTMTLQITGATVGAGLVLFYYFILNLLN